MPAPLVIFGCGYIGERLARAALADGQRVRACRRQPAPLAALEQAGAEVRSMDASRPKQFGPSLFGLTRPIVVYAVPPPPNLPAGEAVRRAGQAALAAGASVFVYLGSAGVYGNRADEEWVDEETPWDLGDANMTARITEEMAVQTLRSSGLHTVVLRLSAVYGAGRGIRGKLRRGDYRITGDGSLWFSRVHVLDLVSVIRAAIERAQSGSLYCVGDDRPTRQLEYATWLARHLGLPVPQAPATEMGVVPHRARRIRNERMKRELGVKLSYPSFMEGEAQE